MHTELMIAKATSQLPTTKREKIKSKLPSFPRRPEIAVIGRKNLEKRKRAFEMYLRLLLNNKELRNDRNVLEFAEICLVSFLYDCGQKNKYASLWMFPFLLTNNENILMGRKFESDNIECTFCYRKHGYKKHFFFISITDYNTNYNTYKKLYTTVLQDRYHGEQTTVTTPGPCKRKIKKYSQSQHRYHRICL